MESENDTEASAPPPRLVTVNQVVAWNIAWLRREAGMTQQELADLLGWPQNKVSEAERSVSGKRTREFDAQDLIGLSLAFNVPLNALFLPPLDDRISTTYLIRPPGQDEGLGMADLLASVLYGDPEDNSDAVTAYRRRLLTAVGDYHGGDWRTEVARWLKGAEGPGALREWAFRSRGAEAQVQAEQEDRRAWADALEKAAEEGE